jgi:poly(3-hydroxybutyrate) depolymerase
MRTTLWLLSSLLLAADGFAATDIRVDFTLKTTDANGAPREEQRYYYVYRPDGLTKTVPIPMLLVFEASPASGPAGFLHDRANKAGFVVVSCSFSGNSTGTPGTVWTDDNPEFAGFEDYDYITEAIKQVSASQNSNDVFLTGLSKGGHMSLAYACVRPATITAASSVDEFMGLTSNIPTAPLPMIMFHGTLDTNVPYTMMKDTVDAWRAVDSLLNATPVTTSESSPLMPGKVTQATWRDDSSGLQVAFVTIVGGTHTYPTPTVETGYDFTAGLWAFFSQFLTSTQASPQIVSQPVNNIQLSGQPASFRVAASGGGAIRYQWQRNGADIPGATANWHTLPMTTLADNAATFQAVVSNDFGSVTSAAATLTVKAAPAEPAIATQPADQAVVSAQPASFTVISTGAPPLSYQWTKNGVNIAGATAATLAIPAAISSDCGAAFRAVVTNAAGSATSAPATLTVTRASGAPFMLANPDRARVLPGQKASFPVTAWSPSPMTYQWQKGAPTGNMADIPGATEPTYTTPVTTLADHLTLFRCVVSNPVGSVTSASEFLFVTAAPTPPTQITSSLTAAAQVGTPFTYAITSSGGTTPITYSANPLPAGLSVDPDSGVLSGIPAATGDTNIAIGAGNSAGHISATLTLSVMETAPVISIDSWRLANFGASATDPSVAGDMADPDGDGYTNLDEYNFGSQPLNPASVPTALGASPPALDFGPVAVGSTAQATLTVSDTAGSSLDGTVRASGDPFVIASDTPFTLPANGSTDIVVSFTPRVAGAFTGQVTFTSNGGSATVDVTGTGIAPAAAGVKQGLRP